MNFHMMDVQVDAIQVCAAGIKNLKLHIIFEENKRCQHNYKSSL